jgi:hypothetical protein
MVQLGSASALAGILNGTAPNSVSFGAGSNGTLNLAGNNITIGNFSRNGDTPVVHALAAYCEQYRH